MDRAGVGRVCLALPGATLDHPFGEHHDAYRIGGKMFAMVGEMGGISFKVSDIAYEVLTEEGRARPAPYLARAKWVNLERIDAWTNQELAEHLAIAHAIVASKLTKKQRAELGLS
ncbi:MmcQ/YjbR family DNA-binding protein [Brevundimonas lenta]|uniref:Putative DNA-binding protein (MmcQ/YjbR family) n=1 Tax=Brevundimonas lenta TaxID=424796 RepID=A0A7W6JE31_9CAUL|nr:MmcQ/YjbR family DNA-binding protein [Brevundimonas lenta]MBB4082468.1 putative DNA-binding protein (MmcQ/YjbR family) [Brevundimonas lenta]